MVGTFQMGPKMKMKTKTTCLVLVLVIVMIVALISVVTFYICDSQYDFFHLAHTAWVLHAWRWGVRMAERLERSGLKQDPGSIPCWAWEPFLIWQWRFIYPSSICLVKIVNVVSFIPPRPLSHVWNALCVGVLCPILWMWSLLWHPFTLKRICPPLSTSVDIGTWKVTACTSVNYNNTCSMVSIVWLSIGSWFNRHDL